MIGEYGCAGRKRDSKFKIGLVQMSCTQNPEENLQKAIKGIREAAAKGAEIVCLQELFRSQYFCREEKAELFRSGRDHSGAFHGGVSARSQKNWAFRS